MTIIYPQLDGVRIQEDRTLPISLIQAIRKAYDYIGQVDGVVQTTPGTPGPPGPAGPAGPPGTGSSTLTNDITLTTATTTINSPGVPTGDGQLWILRVKQDATGGRAVTWGANVMLGPMIDATFNSAPSTMCIIPYVAFGTKWYVFAMPIMAVPIV